MWQKCIAGPALFALAGVAIACGGSGKSATTPISGTPTPISGTPTPNGPVLHLGAGYIPEGNFRHAVEFLIANPGVRDQRCAEFLALSDLDAERHFEDLNAQVNPHAPKNLTPVPAEQATAGGIIKAVCTDFLTVTPTPPRKQ